MSTDYYMADYTPSKERMDLQMNAPVQSTQAPYVPRSATRSPSLSAELDYPQGAQGMSDYRQNPNHPHSRRRRGQHMRATTMDFAEVVKRGLKYLLEGVAVAAVAYLLLKDRLKLTNKDILILAFTAAFTFAILDTLAPTISLGAKFGAGFGIGQALVPLAIAV